LKWENNSIQYGSNGAIILWILMNVKAKAIFYEWMWMMVQNKIFLGQLTALDVIDINALQWCYSDVLNEGLKTRCLIFKDWFFKNKNFSIKEFSQALKMNLIHCNLLLISLVHFTHLVEEWIEYQEALWLKYEV
jgi:hypothetical protein